MDDIIFRIRDEGVEAFIKKMKEAGIAVDKVGDEFDQTTKDAKEFGDEATKSAKKVEAATGNVDKAAGKLSSSLKVVGAGIAAAFGTAAIARFVTASVKAADTQLKAEAKLLSALDGRRDVQDRLIAQAKQLQSVTTVGDEEIIAQQAYLASLDFTEKQIRDIIAASVDLSAGANIGLDSAVRNLAKSYSGLSGELGELIPQLRGLTVEQLKQGEGVKVISELYRGQAEVLRDTGTGAVKSLQNAVGDLQEELGKAVIDGLQPLAKSLQSLAENEDVATFFKALGTIIGDSLAAAGFAIEVVARLGGDLADLFGLSSEGEGPVQSIEELNKELEVANKLLADTEDALEKVSKLPGRTVAERNALAKDVETRKAQVASIEAVIAARKKFEGLDLSGVFAKEASNVEKATEKVVTGFALLAQQLGEAQKELNNLGPFDAGFDEALRKVQTLAARLEDLNEAAKNVTIGENIAAEIETSLQGITIIDGKEVIQPVADDIETALKEATEAGLSVPDNFGEIQAKAIKENFRARRAAEIENEELLQQERIRIATSGIQQIAAIQATAFSAISRGYQSELMAIEQKNKQGLLSDKEYQKQRAAILTKQAKADKAAAIIQSVINTAVAVTKALPNLILAGLALALGTVETAFIAKQPIPKFAKGVKYVDGKGYPNGVDTVPAMLTKGERVTPKDRNKKYWDVLNAIHDDRPELIMKAIAKMGIPVQFKAPQDELYKPMVNMQKLVSGDRDNIDLNPLIMASDRSRFSLGRKLDKINANLEKMGDTRRMTKA